MTRINDTTSGSLLGNAVKRREDPALIRGERHYSGDLVRPDMLHVAFVRSSVPYGRITDIDATAVPSTVTLYTGHDLTSVVVPPPVVPEVFARPVLVRDTVHYVGDLVAMVVGPDERGVHDIASDVWVDYETLDGIAHIERALDEDAPIVFPEAGTNLVWSETAGNSEDPLGDAEITLSQRLVQQRLAPLPMETAGILAEPDGSGGLVIRFGTQDPSNARRVFARSLGIDPDKVRIIVPAVGGGFGAKGSTYPEHVAVAEVALKTGRPVRWIERRTENLINMVHGRGQVQYVEIGATREGRVTGLKAHFIDDAGGWPTIAAHFGEYTMQMASGVYDIPKVQLSADAVVTTRTPIGAYRGAGRPEAIQMIERMMDLLALELDIDRVEVRRRNLMEPFSTPRPVATGVTYDSGNYVAALDHALDVAGWDALVRDRDARRASGDRMLLGVGVSAYSETTIGITPHAEAGGITVEADGSIIVRAGGSSHGQGHQTTFAQLAAHRFNVPMEKITVVQSDTALVPDGVAGTYASRTIQLAGSAVDTASTTVINRAKNFAADILEANPVDIEVVPGGLGVKGVPGEEVDWAQLAQHAAAHDDPLVDDTLFESADATYPFGAHVAVVEIDQDTGWVRLVKHVAVDDPGNVINPMLVLGQQHGGVAQGIGQALFEDAAFDEHGYPLRGNLVSYTIPTAVDIPMIETGRTVTPTPLNPLGAKGVGECGTLGSTPAIHSAVMDALSPLGIRHIDLPLTPDRVWEAIAGGSETA